MIDGHLIKRIVTSLIEKFTKKDKEVVRKMAFDVTKVEEYYADLLAKRDEAVKVGLADKNTRVQARLEEARVEYENKKASIPAEVEAEIIAEATEPYKYNIELCESFFADEVVEETETVEAE